MKESPMGGTHLGEDPQTGNPVLLKLGPFGPYLQVSLPLYMCVYIYTHTRICIYIYIYVYMCVYACMYMYPLAHMFRCV